MKKLLLSFFGLLLLQSCKDDDYETIDSLDKIKIDSLVIPLDTMKVNGIQSIKTYSTYSSTCKGFYGYDYIHADQFTREVTAYQYQSNGNCYNHTHVLPSVLKFNPQKVGAYTFKFWTGDNQWTTKTIHVIQ